MPDSKNDQDQGFDLDDSPFGDVEGGDVNLDDFPGPDEFGDDFPELAGADTSDGDGDADDFGDIGATSDDEGSQDDAFGRNDDGFGDDAFGDDDDSFANQFPDEAESDDQDYPEEPGEELEEGEQASGLAGKLKRQAIPLAAAVFGVGFIGYAGLTMFGPMLFGPSAPPQATFTAPQGAEPPQADQAPPPAQQTAAQVAPDVTSSPPEAEAVAPSGLPTAPVEPVPADPASMAQLPDQPPQMEPPVDAPVGPGPAEAPSVGQQAHLPGTGEVLPFDEGDAPEFNTTVQPVSAVVPAEEMDQFVSKNDLADILSNTIENSLDTRFNQVLDAVDMVSSDVSSLMGSFDSIEARLDDVVQDVTDVRASVSGVESKVDNYMLKVDELELRLDNLEINGNVRLAAAEESAEEEAADAPVVADAVLPGAQKEEKADAPAQEASASPAPEKKETAKATAPAPKKSQTASAPRKATPARAPRPAQGGSLTPPTKPMVVEGYTLKGVSRGLAWVDTGHGIIRVAPGQTIDGLGRVQRISQGQGDWMVTTEAGLIVP